MGLLITSCRSMMENVPNGFGKLLAIMTQDKLRAIKDQDYDKLRAIYDEDKLRSIKDQERYMINMNKKLAIDRINQMSDEELMRDYHSNYGKIRDGRPVRQPVVVEHWSVTELSKIMDPRIHNNYGKIRDVPVVEHLSVTEIIDPRIYTETFVSKFNKGVVFKVTYCMKEVISNPKTLKTLKIPPPGARGAEHCHDDQHRGQTAQADAAAAQGGRRRGDVQAVAVSHRPGPWPGGRGGDLARQEGGQEEGKQGGQEERQPLLVLVLELVYLHNLLLSIVN
jgi:hypothetical protein